MNVERPHDTFFKQLMNDPAVLRDFIGSLLPEEVLNCLDLNSIRIIDTEKSNRKYKSTTWSLKKTYKLITSGFNASR